MPQYTIQQPDNLTSSQIQSILSLWDVDAWTTLSDTEFIQKFQGSEFHLLLHEDRSILCVARINLGFQLIIAGHVYTFPELVGFVSKEKGRGYGSKLLTQLTDNLKSRKLECIGFCEKHVRPFYEKCAIHIMYGQAKFIKEMEDSAWISSTDDDILDITLSPQAQKLLMGLSEVNAGHLECNI